jgi:hypothetical protein
MCGPDPADDTRRSATFRRKYCCPKASRSKSPSERIQRFYLAVLGDSKRPKTTVSTTDSVDKAATSNQPDSRVHIPALQPPGFFTPTGLHLLLSQWLSSRSVSGSRMNFTVVDHVRVNVFGSSNVNSASMWP